MDCPESPTVRPATAADAEAIGRLAEQFAAYLRGLGDPTGFQLNAETYLRDGFGANPAFFGLVTEDAGRVVGYLLYHFGYDSDQAARVLHVVDLYVAAGARRHGAGRALMSAAARVCREAGGVDLRWAVYLPNTLAAAFYENIGAEYTVSLRHMRLKAAAVQSRNLPGFRG